MAKKKLKDLTPEERKKFWCNKWCFCSICPYYMDFGEICMFEKMEEEVEVDESNND